MVRSKHKPFWTIWPQSLFSFSWISVCRVVQASAMFKECLHFIPLQVHLEKNLPWRGWSDSLHLNQLLRETESRGCGDHKNLLNVFPQICASRHVFVILRFPPFLLASLGLQFLTSAAILSDALFTSPTRRLVSPWNTGNRSPETGSVHETIVLFLWRTRSSKRRVVTQTSRWSNDRGSWLQTNKPPWYQRPSGKGVIYRSHRRPTTVKCVPKHTRIRRKIKIKPNLT